MVFMSLGVCLYIVPHLHLLYITPCVCTFYEGIVSLASAILLLILWTVTQEAMFQNIETKT